MCPGTSTSIFSVHVAPSHRVQFRQGVPFKRLLRRLTFLRALGDYAGRVYNAVKRGAEACEKKLLDSVVSLHERLDVDEGLAHALGFSQRRASILISRWLGSSLGSMLNAIKN